MDKLFQVRLGHKVSQLGNIFQVIKRCPSYSSHVIVKVEVIIDYDSKVSDLSPNFKD